MKFYRVIPVLIIVSAVALQGVWAFSSGGSGEEQSHFNFSMLKPGDLIFCYNPSMDWLIPGHWTHVAIFVGYDSHGQGWIIEATTGLTGGPSGVHYAKVQELDEYPEIAIGQVKASQAVINGAIAWIKTKIGDPYDYWIMFREIDNGKYYCSELVWAGYYVQGIDLDSHPGFSWEYLWGVAPQEIYQSSHVVIISHQEA